LKFEYIDGNFMLNLGSGFYVSFQKNWVEQLKTLPYDRFGDFIRSNIYPALSNEEKRIWNKSTISNRDLQAALQAIY
jgi:hypothetical protein